MEKWLSDVWKWFKSFFNEDTGASMTRLVNLIWTVTLCSCLFFIVVADAISKKELKLPDLPSAYIAVTSLYLAAKVGQRIWGENGSPDGTVTTSTTPTSGSSSSDLTKIVSYLEGLATSGSFSSITVTNNVASGSLPTTGSAS